LRAIYKETETRLLNDDVQEVEIDFLRMILEEELLGELIENIFDRIEEY